MLKHLQDGLGKAHEELSGEFSKMKEFGKITETLASRFDQLASLGANVTTEDVVKAATGLVSSGLGAKEVATLLADMPTEPQLLGEWVSQRAVEAAEAAAKFQQAFGDARHQLGTLGLHVLASHSMGVGEQPGGAAGGPVGQPNPLQGEAPGPVNSLGATPNA